VSDTATELPQLQRFGECWGCNQTIGWVLTPRNRWVPVNPQAHPRGTIALMADGERGVDMYANWVPEGEERRHVGNLYVNHTLTCPARGIRSVGWTARHGGRPNPAREQVRAAKLATDQHR
jgi:hypothetical protein